MGRKRKPKGRHATATTDNVITRVTDKVPLVDYNALADVVANKFTSMVNECGSGNNFCYLTANMQPVAQNGSLNDQGELYTVGKIIDAISLAIETATDPNSIENVYDDESDVETRDAEEEMYRAEVAINYRGVSMHDESAILFNGSSVEGDNEGVVFLRHSTNLGRVYDTRVGPVYFTLAFERKDGFVVLIKLFMRREKNADVEV